MANLDFLGIKARNLKCFGDSYHGIDRIAPINIIVGRNNTGKTSLIDMIAFVHSSSIDRNMYYNDTAPDALITIRLNDTMSTPLLRIPQRDPQSKRLFSYAFRDRSTVWNLCQGKQLRLVPDPELPHEGPDPQVNALYADIQRIGLSAFTDMALIRIAADRDVAPEIDDAFESPITNHDLKPTGEGATRVLARMLRRTNNQHWRLIKNVVLDALNFIYEVDGTFDDIHALHSKLDGKEIWEIHLEYGKQTRVALSKMGSGVKTILLSLLAIHVMPEVAYAKSLDQCIFCFEELENNLHPAIQKRLFRYLRDIVRKHQCIMFITTHSHVVIDLFSSASDAQLIHVTHDEQNRELSRVEPITAREHHTKVFDDLGVRASDLLQSNCVIWVEGPSDRIYFNKWIELFDPELSEHDDYEFAFTAGALLAHYTYEDPNDDDKIEALRVNRNAIVLMDRDKAEADKLKAWVDRIRQELTGNGGFPWVTQGKEVENYIPIEVLRDFLKEPELEPPHIDVDIIKLICEKGERNYEKDKVLLAQRICSKVDRAMLERWLDVGSKMEEVCQKIRKWNSRPAKGPGNKGSADPAPPDP